MHKKRLAVGGMMGIIVLTILVLGGSGAFATQTCTTDSNTGIETCVDPENGTTYGRTSSVNASVTVGVGSCTFERDSSTSGSYTGTLANGATPSPINGSIFEIKCNDGGGSAVYAIGYSNDEFANTDLVSSLGGNTNIHTGVYDSTAATHDSSWAMRMQSASGGYAGAVASFGDFANFHEIPSNYTMVASYPSSTLDPTGAVTTGGKIQAVYQAYASYTQPAGTYTGQVKYTMVHPNDNAMIIDEDINDIVYLQDFASLSNIERVSVIDSMVEGQTYTKKDSRDQQDYTIAKLADGKVWMTKNLNLAGGTALSVDTTDVTSEYIDSFTTSNNLTKNGSAIVLPASSTVGFNTDNYSFVYNSGNNTDTCTDTQACYSYYSWDAATLGSGRSISTDNTDAPYSICPKGWKLPSTYDGSGAAAGATDFRALVIAFGGSNSIQEYTDSTSPTGSELYALLGPGTMPNFLLAGVYSDDSFQGYGNIGAYWSSTSVTEDAAQGFVFDSQDIYSADYDPRGFGLSVRCLVAE